MQLLRSGDELLEGHAPDTATLGFSQTRTPDVPTLLAIVQAARTGTALAHVAQVSLTASFAAGDPPPSFDGLRFATSPATLAFFVRARNALDAQGMQALLRGAQLAWALERGALRLQLCEESDTGWRELARIDSKDLMRPAADRPVVTVDDAPLALDDAEYAEYLALFFEEERASYLRRLSALRAERAKARPARELERTSDGASPDGDAAGLVPHTMTTGGVDVVNGGATEVQNAEDSGATL
ncbi:hypothetical protein PsYK624_148100 [Phanerochaete sordida]|uniref:Uncharacterized protein n=1 Tax=Phanerochaete sordida TaxID=48140 RepID=A0A9P3LLR3_9APHY|nr:hypothetical protein PsYK624_148100 [Phanerochaete sordida]